MSYKNFKQTDTKWANDYYSGYTIKSQGCGPTSIADAVYHIDSSITPAKTAKWMEDNGCSCHGCGTYYSGMVKALKHYGYEGASQINYTNIYGAKNNKQVTDFLDKIKSGNYVGIACMGKSIWTDSGHYVFIKSYDGKSIKIYDPYNKNDACESTTRAKWEPYIKYLFLIPKKLHSIKTTKGGVRIRKEPKVATKTTILGKIPKGTELPVYNVHKGIKYTYKQVKYQGQTGWIMTTNTKKI